MSIISHELESSYPNGDRVNVRYKFTHSAGRIDYINKLVDNQGDGPDGPNFLAWVDADMLSMYAKLEQSAADSEVNEAEGLMIAYQNPDKVAEYQAQNDYDRRVLGRTMLLVDVHAFYACLPFFQAVETRGGPNANARATYLGITRAEYDLIAARYSEVQGIAFFLDSDSHWTDLPDSFV